MFPTRETHLLHIFGALVAILVLPTVNPNPGKDGCLVPDEAELFSILVTNGGVILNPPISTENDEQISQAVSDHTTGVFEFKGRPQEVERLDMTPADWSCPVGEKPPKDAPVNAASTCPWRYVIHRDPLRYPQTIFHAVRRCGSCLDLDGSVLPGTRCEPVKYPTKVLRQKGCQRPGTAMQYDVENFEQIVAFHCIAGHISSIRSKVE